MSDFQVGGRIMHTPHTTKWLASDNQLFVGYSIIPTMSPSYGLTAQYGYDIYQDNNFYEAHSVILEGDDITFYPKWTTFSGQFVSTQELEDSGCRQLLWSEFIDSKFVATPKIDWPLLATYADVLRSPNGDFLAYLTTGEECGMDTDVHPGIVLIDLNSEHIAISDIAELSGDITLIDWFEISTIK